jgi:indole-3-glycerol phosphate synthase
MRGSRRFSQAISEGDGISLLAAVADGTAARTAEAAGAEALVVRAQAAGVREATELPILWSVGATASEDARRGGADAYVVAVEGLEDEDGRLERLHVDALGLGLDCVVAVRDEDQLRVALDRLDPDILLLSAQGASDDAGLEHVLSLLPDVPAGKLAIADLELSDREQVGELERAGIDAVIVSVADVRRFAVAPPVEG